MKRTFLILYTLAATLACAARVTSPTVPMHVEKEKMLWMDAEASFMTNFSTSEKITALLDRIAETGFNSIVVDVRPVAGDVLYRSEFMTPYEDAATRGYDYLQFMIDEAKKRGLKVTVSTTIFTVGYLPGDPHGRKGHVWRDAELAKLVCVGYTPDKGIVPLLEDDTKRGTAGGFAFLNPVHPDSQAYVMRFVEEIVAKYDVDGYALDYLRFPDSESDFSDFTRGRFEKCLGKKIARWPADVFTYNADGSHNKGQYYYQWWQFRSGVIHDFVKSARDRIKAIHPNVKLLMWTGSWLAKESGQNWASPSYDLSTDPADGASYREWLTADYSRGALAPLLDTYLLGTYVTDTYMGDVGPDGYRDPVAGADPRESMEYQTTRGLRYVANACPLYGNVAATNPATTVEQQIYYCLTHTDGVMVFDVCHFIDDPLRWAAFKRGIERAEKELAGAK